MKPAITLVAAATLLSACASQGQFPSLAKRPAEQALEALPAGADRIGAPLPAPASPTPDASAAPRPVSSEMIARLAKLKEAAGTAHTQFSGKQNRAGQLVAAARGAAVASEAWSVATVAIADLESARSDAMTSLAELDRLYVAERIDGGDGGAIAAVRDQVTAWVADEDAVLAELGARMAT